MSISTIHKALENRSCAIGCFGFMAAAFAFSFLAMGPQCDRGGQSAQEAGPAVAKVGDIAIYASALDQNVAIRERQLGGTEPPGPADLARLYAEAMQNSIDSAYLQLLAEREGVAATVQSAEQAIPSLWDQQVEGQIAFLELTGQLKSGATEKEFADFVKGRGMDLAEERKNFEAAFAERLRDPATQLAVLAEVSQRSILEKLGRGLQATDEEVKAGFDTYVFKRVLLLERGDAGKAAADKVLAEIKGGLSFERAMEKYSKDQPMAKQKISERTDPIPVSSLRLNDALKPLVAMKAGQVSEPIDQPLGTTIYKLVKIERNLPSDFAAKQADYKKGFLQSLAGAKLKEQMDALKASTPVAFESKALEALNDWHKLTTDPAAPTGKERDSQLAEIASRAKGVASANPADERLAALAYFAAVDERWNGATPAERETLRDERIASIEEALKGSDNADLRLELVDLYAAKKQGEPAFEHLLEGARVNLDPREAGQRRYYLLSAKLSLLKKEGLITAEQEKAVRAELDRWQASFKELTRFEAEEKQRQEAEKKRFEEAQKKAAPKPTERTAPAKGG